VSERNLRFFVQALNSKSDNLLQGDNMKPSQLLYLSQDDVKAVGLTMAEIIDALEIAFREKGKGLTEMPPKPGIHPGGGDNFIHAMPAYIPAMKSAGVKWVSGFPENHKMGLPYITGLLILNDPESGLPISADRRRIGVIRPVPGSSGIIGYRDTGLRCSGSYQS
jgi:hypothetical protein